MHVAALFLVLLVAHAAAHPVPSDEPAKEEGWLTLVTNTVKDYFGEKYTQSRDWLEKASGAIANFVRLRDLGGDIRAAETTLIAKLKEIYKKTLTIVGLDARSPNEADKKFNAVMKDVLANLGVTMPSA